MSHPLTPPDPALDAERERVVHRLSEAFAADDLALDQLESRMALVWRASSPEELGQLVADLPASPPAPAPAGAPPAVRVETGSKTLLAVMGGVMRRGVWRVPGSLRAVAVMGAVEIDLREAELSSAVTEITAVAVMGAIQVIVPPGVRLESDGVALLGGFEDQLVEPAAAASTAPLVRVRGLALAGGVEAKVVERGVKIE